MTSNCNICFKLICLFLRWFGNDICKMIISHGSYAIALVLHCSVCLLMYKMFSRTCLCLLFFLGLFDIRPFTVLSNYFTYFTPRQHGILANWEPSTPKNCKHVCSASESSSYEDYMAIYVLSTIFQPYHFASFQVDFEGYWKFLNRW